jgi:hypothetical protein
MFKIAPKKCLFLFLFFLHLPRKMEPIEGSEMSAFKPQMPGKYSKENVLQMFIHLFNSYNG